MINLEKIIQTITTRISPLMMTPDKCCKIRSSRSNCSLCQDICPENAVKIDNKSKEILFTDDCSECGLCTTTCPTGAISRQEPTELNLYNKIKTIGENEGTVVLSCQQNKHLSSKSLKVSCLGSLTFEFIFSISMLKFPIYVVYKNEACATCPMNEGIKNYQKQVEKVEKLHKEMQIRSFNIKHTEEPPKISKPKPNEEVNIERRKFFGLVADEAKKAPKAIMDDFFKTSSPKKKTLRNMPKNKISRLKLLQSGLDEVDKNNRLDITNNRYMSPKLVSDCYLCKACTTLCPVGAIQYEESKGIFLYEAYCTGCGLCEDVCFYKSVKLCPRNLKNIKDNNIKELVKESKKECSNCNKKITSSDFTENCFSCKKKIKNDSVSI